MRFLPILLTLMWRMRIMAMTDELTRLPNRRHLLGVARAAVERGEPFSLLAFDVDHFKRTNDTYAQWSIGDTLERIAARANEVLYRAKESGRNRVLAATAA